MVYYFCNGILFMNIDIDLFVMVMGVIGYVVGWFV